MEKKRLGSIKIDMSLVQKIKIVAAEQGTTITGLANSLLSDPVERLYMALVRRSVVDPLKEKVE
jgi:hypothetical protein